MRRHAHRLPRWQHHALAASGTALLASGAAWLAIHYSIGAGRGELPHPAEAWLLRLHGAVAMAALFVLGVLAAAHVPQGWRLAGRHGWHGQRSSGVALCALGAGLTATGYLLYYFAPETLRPALGWLHAVLGVAMAATVALHRRRR